jgi:YVTN family beta-propeller protein
MKQFTFVVALGIAGGCAADAPSVPEGSLAHRAYIVSLESEELTVIDLDRLEIIARVPTGGLANHMAELNGDFTKLYVDSSESDEVVVVDTRSFAVLNRIPLGRHPTHAALSRDGHLLAVMNEDEGTGAVSFIDTDTDLEIKRLPGFYTPHFMRFAPDGRYAYVANLGAYHLTRVDLETLEIDGHIALDGFAGPPDVTPAPGEGGFADAQIDATGVLYAAHHALGRVLVYDTAAQAKLPEIAVGSDPWIVFAEHPFPEIPRRHLVPSFGDQQVSIIDGDAATVSAALPGDEEAYGVNYSSLTPDKAFVMNRVREDIAVVDTARGEITSRIPVGGNTETASTTADGAWIVAAVSSANQVVVIDAETNEIVKTFDDVGQYPWSVTIPLGQNYCH